MARVAVLGGISGAEDLLLPLDQVAGHRFVLAVHHPSQSIRADVVLTDEAGFLSLEHRGSDLETPVIVATREPSTCTDLLDKGASAVIALPVDAAELSSAIYALITPGRYLSRQVVAAMIARPGIGGTTPFALSEREVDVLTHLAAGRSDAEIACTLFLSRATVHTHLLNLRRKLGARNRTHAVVLAIQHGVIAPHAPSD